MTDIPILFSASMIQALRAGRKTMTRRLAWRDFPDPEVLVGQSSIGTQMVQDEATGSIVHVRKPTPWQKVKLGDRLWVREMFSRHLYRDGCWYWADGRVADHDSERPRPSIHMPRWASRLTLVVTATKIEKLQDISIEDIRDEGCKPVKSEWALLWDSIHGEGAFTLNPDVVAITFAVHQQNIDTMKTAA